MGFTEVISPYWLLIRASSPLLFIARTSRGPPCRLGYVDIWFQKDGEPWCPNGAPHVIGKETKRLLLVLMNSWVALQRVCFQHGLFQNTSSLLTQFESYFIHNYSTEPYKIYKNQENDEETSTKIQPTYLLEFFVGSESSHPTKPRIPHPARRCRGDVWKPRRKSAIDPGAEKGKFITLRIMRSQNWWELEIPEPCKKHIQTPLFWRVQWFLGH